MSWHSPCFRHIMCSLPQICASDSYPHLDLALSSIDVMQAQTWDKTITKCWDEALDSGQLEMPCGVSSLLSGGLRSLSPLAVQRPLMFHEALSDTIQKN